jgi:hypothetical protein
MRLLVGAVRARIECFPGNHQRRLAAPFATSEYAFFFLVHRKDAPFFILSSTTFDYSSSLIPLDFCSDFTHRPELLELPEFLELLDHRLLTTDY